MRNHRFVRVRDEIVRTTQILLIAILNKVPPDPTTSKVIEEQLANLVKTHQKMLDVIDKF